MRSCWNDTFPDTFRRDSQGHVLNHLLTLLFFVVLIWNNALSLGNYFKQIHVFVRILFGRGAACTLSGWIKLWVPLIAKLELRDVGIRTKYIGQRSLLSLYVLGGSCLHYSLLLIWVIRLVVLSLWLLRLNLLFFLSGLQLFLLIHLFLLHSLLFKLFFFLCSLIKLNLLCYPDLFDFLRWHLDLLFCCSFIEHTSWPIGAANITLLKLNWILFIALNAFPLCCFFLILLKLAKFLGLLPISLLDS